MAVQLLSNAGSSQGNMSDGSITRSVSLEDFKAYMLAKLHSREDVRQRLAAFRKYGRLILENPLAIKQLSPSTARKLLLALAAFRDYLKLYGMELKIDLAELRKIAPKYEHKPSIIEYEEEEDIVGKALSELGKVETTKYYYGLAAVSFFTGLRSTEIIYMVKNWPILRKLDLGEVVAVELNYMRKSKKAFITLMPKALAKIIPELSEVIGDTAFKNMRDDYGFNVSVMRKAHMAICSRTMQIHEIDLLQGRLSERHVVAFLKLDLNIRITIQHYIKHIRSIAEKYVKAYAEFMHIAEKALSKFTENSKQP